jgi:hypothetical protein
MAPIMPKPYPIYPPEEGAPPFIMLAAKPGY